MSLHNTIYSFFSIQKKTEGVSPFPIMISFLEKKKTFLKLTPYYCFLFLSSFLFKFFVSTWKQVVEFYSYIYNTMFWSIIFRSLNKTRHLSFVHIFFLLYRVIRSVSLTYFSISFCYIFCDMLLSKESLLVADVFKRYIGILRSYCKKD